MLRRVFLQGLGAAVGAVGLYLCAPVRTLLPQKRWVTQQDVHARPEHVFGTPIERLQYVVETKSFDSLTLTISEGTIAVPDGWIAEVGEVTWS